MGATGNKRKEKTQPKGSKSKKENSMVWTILPIIISLLALGISIYMALLQYHYSQAEYEYKRNPTFNISLHGFGLKREIVDGEVITFPFMQGFAVDIDSMNNFGHLYIIAPDYSTEEIWSRESFKTEAKEELVEKGVFDYFNQAYADGSPDMKIGDNWYFYRFFVFKNQDNEYDIQGAYFKAQPMRGSELSGMTFLPFTDVDQLEFEKAHLDDENYEGERRIAAQYREIKNYLIPD